MQKHKCTQKRPTLLKDRLILETQSTNISDIIIILFVLFLILDAALSKLTLKVFLN